MASAWLRNGPEYLHKVRKNLKEWMEENEWSSLKEMRGKYGHGQDPESQSIRGGELHDDAPELGGS
jgi:hypothetical protein